MISQGLLVGAIAAVLCLQYRQHHFLNLAGAAWVCLGGWLGACLLNRNMTPLGEHALLTLPIGIIVLGALQILVFLILNDSLRNHPASILFISIATHLILTTAGANWIPLSRGDTVPSSYNLKGAERVLSILFYSVSVLFPLLVLLLQRSRSYSIEALRFRSTAGPQVSWAYLAKLQAVQILFLLVLGGISVDIHKGHFGAMNLLMVTTGLSVISAKGHPIKAFLFGAVLGLAEFVCSSFPALASLAIPLCLTAFLILAIVVYQPFTSIALFPPNQWVMGIGEGGPKSVYNHVAIAIVAVSAVFAWQMIGQWSQLRLLEVAALLTYGVLAYVGIRCFGVLTAIWPTVGSAVIYTVTTLSSQSAPIVGIGVIIVVVSFTAYLILLRSVSAHFGLLLDLSVIVIINQTIIAVSAISGIDNNVAASGRFFVNGGEHITPYLIWIMLVVVLFGSIWLHIHPRGRIAVFNSSDVCNALRNGFRPFRTLATAFVGMVILAAAIRWLEVGTKGHISPDSTSPLVGIATLFLGFMIATTAIIRGFIVGAFLVACVPGLLRIQGEWRDAWFAGLIALAVIYEATLTKWKTSH